MKHKLGNASERTPVLESKNLIKRDGAVKQRGIENLENHYLRGKTHQES